MNRQNIDLEEVSLSDFPIPRSTRILLEIIVLGVLLGFISVLLGQPQRYEIRLLILGVVMLFMIYYLFQMNFSDNNDLIATPRDMSEDGPSKSKSQCQCKGGGCPCDQVEFFTNPTPALISSTLARHNIQKHTGSTLTEDTGPYSNMIFKEGKNYGLAECSRPVYQGSSVPLHKDATIKSNRELELNDTSPEIGDDCPHQYAFDGSGKTTECRKFNKPSLDGTTQTRQSLAMFSCNRCSPDCCPSSYTCPGGCVCMTPEQRDLLENHGTNRLRLEPENMMS